jgi:hypothetical protein
MRRNTTRLVWTVLYPDQHDITGVGVAHFEDADDAQRFATAFRAISVREESVPARIADRWTFTRWGRG